MNRSKEQDPRMWKKWERSGATGTYRSAMARTITAEAPSPTQNIAPLLTERRLPPQREYLMTLLK